MRVTLLAPFPVRKVFGQRLIYSTKNSVEHHATWIVNCMELLLQRKDIDLHLVTLAPHISKDYLFFENGVHYHLLRGGHYLGQIASFYQLDRLRLKLELTKIMPDVIEAFGTEGPYAYAAVSSGFPTVVYIQGIIFELIKKMRASLIDPQWIHHFFTQYFERWTIRKGNYYIAENEFGADFVKRLNPNAKIYILPNIISPLFFQENIEHAVDNQEILFVGSLSILKGGIDLIGAFEIISKIKPKTFLTVIGNVSLDIKKIIELLPTRTQESISLLGKKDQTFIINKMKEKPIFVYPSKMDSSPNSVYEAMIAGLPVVATKVGGLPYMIEDGKNGYLIDSQNPELLAERILYLLEHPEERRRIGTNASRVTRKRLDPQRIAQELVAIYMEVAAQE